MTARPCSETRREQGRPGVRPRGAGRALMDGALDPSFRFDTQFTDRERQCLVAGDGSFEVRDADGAVLVEHDFADRPVCEHDELDGHRRPRGRLGRLATAPTSWKMAHGHDPTSADPVVWYADIWAKWVRPTDRTRQTLSNILRMAGSPLAMLAGAKQGRRGSARLRSTSQRGCRPGRRPRHRAQALLPMRRPRLCASLPWGERPPNCLGVSPR